MTRRAPEPYRPSFTLVLTQSQSLPPLKPSPLLSCHTSPIYLAQDSPLMTTVDRRFDDDSCVATLPVMSAILEEDDTLSMITISTLDSIESANNNAVRRAATLIADFIPSIKRKLEVFRFALKSISSSNFRVLKKKV